MLLFLNTKLRKKLLGYTFTHPDRKFYVRELAGAIKEDPGNLSRELRRLEEEGVYYSRTEGNLKYYSLNQEYTLFEELKKMIFKTEGVGGTLKDLVEGFPGIRCAFIYGSYAREQEKAKSDVDLIVVGEIPQMKFTPQIRDLEAKLRREINFTIYTPEEFKKESKKKGGFLNLILQDKVVLLKGILPVV